MENKIPRVAFTIILNGLHHLMHKDYYKFIIDNFDLWVIAEGAVHSNGSTSWCKPMPDEYHNNGRSKDGTHEFLLNLANNPKVKVLTHNGLWHSKDHQVNTCIDTIKKQYNEAFLWQIDCDEQWQLGDIQEAEKIMIQHNLDCASFPCKAWIGKNILATGEWGECINSGYTRLWKWKGQSFQKHEPPLLEGGNGNQAVVSIYFDHYNYYFEQDVEFKEKWYNHHLGIHKNWKLLQNKPKEEFPVGIDHLFDFGWNRMTKTKLFYVD
jgi:hypothetical protein